MTTINQDSTKIAKVIVKNKFWVVEDNGNKIATIQAVDEGGVVYVHDREREIFPNIKLLSKKYNIEFSKSVKRRKSITYDVYGYPTPCQPHNILYDLPRKLPIFTKVNKSKSFFCAGYYIVKLTNNWTEAFCPKTITLNRYEYQGPFKTEEAMLEQLRIANGE